MATYTKVLGPTLNPNLTYSIHIRHILVQTHNPLQMIKALTARGWGKQKDTLMVTYKAVMRPALEYASFIWSPLASSISINKDAHKIQTYNICMTKHSYVPYTSTYSSMRHNTNGKHNIHHIPYTNIQHTSTLQCSK